MLNERVKLSLKCAGAGDGLTAVASRTKGFSVGKPRYPRLAPLPFRRPGRSFWRRVGGTLKR
jgi:hypothetical protein